jgi:signal transduction histidine kinase
MKARRNRQMKFNLKLILLILAVFTSLSVLTLGTFSCGRASTSMMSIEESNNRVAVATVHVAAVGLGEMLKGVIDENQRVEIVRKFIDPIRFFGDKSGYFYVYYYNCINLAHAVDKTLPGKDLSDYQDMKGKYVIRELSAEARKGGGFVTYYWPHPETKEEQRKIGYVEPIPGTDYFIGTGYYPDTR